MRRHAFGRNDPHPAAHPSDQLAQIVEQVIDLRIAQIGNLDSPRRAVEPAGNPAVGLDQQRRDPPGGGRLRHLRQVVTAKPFGLCRRELVGQCSQLRLILRLDDLPGAFPKFIDWQGIGVDR